MLGFLKSCNCHFLLWAEIFLSLVLPLTLHLSRLLFKHFVNWFLLLQLKLPSFLLSHIVQSRLNNHPLLYSIIEKQVLLVFTNAIACKCFCFHLATNISLTGPEGLNPISLMGHCLSLGINKTMNISLWINSSAIEWLHIACC